MSEGLFSAVEIESAGRAGYRLHHLEVFNCGTFHAQVWRLAPAAETAPRSRRSPVRVDA
jgi:hypothetical protein